MLIGGCYNLIEKCFYNTLKCVTVRVGLWFWSKKKLPEVVKIFSQINISVIFAHSLKIKSFTVSQTCSCGL